MKINQSGTKSGDPCPYKPAPLWLQSTLFFMLRMEDFVLGWAETLRMSQGSRVE